MDSLFASDAAGATFSPCRTYRYRLWRRWSLTGPSAVFIMLNPSTADETENDPTIRRCIGFAKSWGCSAVHVVNIFAFRATDPKVMRAADMPIGPRNDIEIRHTAEAAEGPIVAAWGAHGCFLGRGDAVRRMIGARLQCLGTTKDGSPRHPLYVRGDAPLLPFGEAR